MLQSVGKKLTVIIFLALLTGCFSKQQIQNTVDMTTGLGSVEKGQEAIKTLAVTQAQEVYKQLKSLETDFSSGPCIAERLMDDWVADIAHNPRRAIDNLPANQCQSFIKGETHHFVELDFQGNLIRAQ